MVKLTNDINLQDFYQEIGKLKVKKDDTFSCIFDKSIYRIDSIGFLSRYPNSYMVNYYSVDKYGITICPKIIRTLDYLDFIKQFSKIDLSHQVTLDILKPDGKPIILTVFNNIVSDNGETFINLKDLDFLQNTSIPDNYLHSIIKKQGVKIAFNAETDTILYIEMNKKNVNSSNSYCLKLGQVISTCYYFTIGFLAGEMNKNNGKFQV